jgi:hypothetical protein
MVKNLNRHIDSAAEIRLLAKFIEADDSRHDV